MAITLHNGQEQPKLIGGSLCLDFVNTVSWRGDPSAQIDHLGDFTDLMFWLVAAGVVAPKEARKLGKKAGRRPELAALALGEAKTMREALAVLFKGECDGRDAALETVNRFLKSAPGRRRLLDTGTAFEWKAREGNEPVLAPLWTILWDAATLLTSPHAGRVKACADPRCGWLFLDLSRGRRRRWCSMEDCGNRAKARRHYARTREAAAHPAG